MELDGMQAYEKLPIYRKARALLKECHVLTARMSKSYKYTLGQKLRDSAHDLTESVFLAYEERDNLPAKITYIDKIKRCTQSLLVNYRIANELQLVPIKLYGEQVEIIVSIVRQCRGWEQSVKSQLHSV